MSDYPTFANEQAMAEWILNASEDEIADAEKSAPRVITVDAETYADLAEQWADFVQQRTDVRVLAEQAEAGTISYDEYDEASYDLNEIGRGLAETMAEILGLSS